MIMSKYDQFIENLNKEVDNMEVTNISLYVVQKHKEEKNSNTKLFKPKFISLATCSFILVFALILTFAFINKQSTTKPIKPNKPPVIATSINDAYAFEIMAAGNIIYSNSLKQTKSLKRRLLTKANPDLNNVATKINEHYLTIKQMLKNEKLNYEVFDIDSELYDNKMIIHSPFSSEFDLQYSIYFNKTKSETEDDEELFNLDGIIVINNNTYKLTGENEIEEDEIETKILVEISESEYFTIEQEKEDDEEEYVYTSYINGKKQNEYAISYEIEDNEIEVEIEMTKNNQVESIKAKIENDKIILKVNFTSYEGRVKVIDEATIIKYQFINENIIIEKKLIN